MPAVPESRDKDYEAEVPALVVRAHPKEMPPPDQVMGYRSDGGDRQKRWKYIAAPLSEG